MHYLNFSIQQANVEGAVRCEEVTEVSIKSDCPPVAHPYFRAKLIPHFPIVVGYPIIPSAGRHLMAHPAIAPRHHLASQVQIGLVCG